MNIYQRRKGNFNMERRIFHCPSHIFGRLLPLCLSHEKRLYYGYPVKTSSGIFFFNNSHYHQRPNVILSPQEFLEDPHFTEFSFISSLGNFDQVTQIEDIQKCLECKEQFRVSENSSDKCNGGPQKVYNGSSYHIYINRKTGPNGPLTDFASTEPTNRPPTVFGLDCEMIYTSHGSELARVSLIEIYKNIIFDFIVSPVGQIYSLHTEHSGITSELLEFKRSFDEVRNIILSTVKSQDILIGHSLELDLATLKIHHQRVIDTSVLDWEGENIHKPRSKRKPSLKQLVKNVLGEEIQSKTTTRGHDSTEDALASLNLALKFAGCIY